jgi:hypothetical protein
MEIASIKAFKNLVLEHAEEMTILALCLTQDRDKATRVVEEVLMEVWDENSFSEMNIGELNRRIRIACEPKGYSFPIVDGKIWFPRC